LLQPAEADVAETGHEAATEGFNAGEVIIGHVSNSDPEHPLFHLPVVLGIDLSVTKHVLMLWIVAALLFLTVTRLVRRYVRQEQLEPSGMMNALEALVVFVRDSITRPNIGDRWLNTWTPMLLTFFLFILIANAIGLVPIFDVLALFNHTIVHAGEESLLTLLTHGGATATGNFNVTAGLATITFFATIWAGTAAHGFIAHWRNLVPKNVAWPIYIILIPIEVMSLFVRPFALTMRLAANMTGGHIAILAIISFVFIFSELFARAAAGIGIGLVFSMPLAVGISALEIIIVFVQAYVFTLLSAVFIGMAINVHH
jgi:F-type H+-transporting ATPase subunit a